MMNNLEYAIKCYKADKVLQQNPSLDVKSWPKSYNIKTYLDPLKMKQVDGAWPKTSGKMKVLYGQWSGRYCHQLVMDKWVMEKFMEWMNAERKTNWIKSKTYLQSFSFQR